MSYGGRALGESFTPLFRDAIRVLFGDECILLVLLGDARIIALFRILRFTNNTYLIPPLSNNGINSVLTRFTNDNI